MPEVLTCEQFTNFLDSQEPIYDKLIIRDIRPEDGWIGHVETGQWEAFGGASRTFDRFRAVFPNVTKPWEPVTKESCIGAPCDPPSTEIGWGFDRTTYGLERKRVKTKLLCFDQIIHVNKAKEHFQQIVSDILKPVTSWESSHYLRKRAAQLAGKKWLANATMSDFTFSWELDAGGNEVVFKTSATPTSKLTPQMLQRRVQPLQRAGYFGKNPFKDQPPLIELVTDYNTTWDLDKAACDSFVSDKWRFNQWDAANAYYRYGLSGQLGNYAVRVDGFPLRFNKTGTNTFQLVMPYKNEAAFVGIGSADNEAFDLAQYQLSFIMHRRAMVWLTQNMEAVNPQMPFAVRSLGGKWNFATDNLGADASGCVIENIARNKGLFFADFEFAAKPQYVEFMEVIFHKREPACVTVCDVCNDDPGYPAQTYDSANDDCAAQSTLQVTPCLNDDTNTYEVAANTITCDGVTVQHQAITLGTTLTELVNQLNDKAGELGVWSVNGGDIQLVGTCTTISVPFVGCVIIT